jgi:hypothetical protein
MKDETTPPEQRLVIVAAVGHDRFAFFQQLSCGTALGQQLSDALPRLFIRSRVFTDRYYVG